MTIFKDSYIFLGSVALLACSVCLGSGLTFSLTPRSIQPGERARLEIQIPLADVGIKDLDEDTQLPEMHDDLLNDAKNIQILDRDFRREHDSLVWRYDITAYEKGTRDVPPVEIRMGPLTFSTEAIPLEVVSTRTPGDLALRDDYGPAKYPIRWLLWLSALGLVAVTAFATYFGKRYYKKLAKRRPAPPPPKPVPEEVPEEWLRKRLALIRERLESVGDDPVAADAIVDDLSLALREYYARRDDKPVEAWTTSEFRRRMTADRAQKLCPVFERCDEWKFTGNLALSPREIAASSLDESERILLSLS